MLFCPFLESWIDRCLEVICWIDIFVYIPVFVLIAVRYATLSSPAVIISRATFERTPGKSLISVHTVRTPPVDAIWLLGMPRLIGDNWRAVTQRVLRRSTRVDFFFLYCVFFFRLLIRKSDESPPLEIGRRMTLFVDLSEWDDEHLFVCLVALFACLSIMKDRVLPLPSSTRYTDRILVD